jgi:hypothetical protein
MENNATPMLGPDNLCRVEGTNHFEVYKLTNKEDICYYNLQILHICHDVSTKLNPIFFPSLLTWMEIFFNDVLSIFQIL